jgi:predicted lipoprotein with Yx(FWY)xxD motif
VNRLIHRSAATAAGLLLLTTAACGGGGGGGGSAQPADKANQKSGTSSASTLETADSGFGQILVDSKGMTLYMFDPDKQSGNSVCDAECLQAWPVYDGPAKAGQGVDQSLLGTTKSTDGQTMATYNDWPLYYFVKDSQPGDVAGQAVNDVWWVMSPDGKPIRQMPAQSGTSGGNSY